MIHKNTTIEKTTGVTYASFGTGDITMTYTPKVEDRVFLGFRTDVPKEINVKLPPLKEQTLDEFQPEVLFSFTNPKSIDSIIYMLKQVKKELLKN